MLSMYGIRNKFVNLPIDQIYDWIILTTTAILLDQVYSNDIEYFKEREKERFNIRNIQVKGRAEREYLLGQSREMRSN